MKKILSILLGLCLFFTNCGTFEKEIRIPRSTIQKAIDKKLPYKKNILLAHVNIKSVDVYFIENRIGLKFLFNGALLSKDIEGEVNFNCNLLYGQEDSSFYLKDFHIIEIALNDHNFSGQGELETILLKLVNEFLGDIPVYTLNKADFKQGMAKLILKEITTKNDSLYIRLAL